MKQAFIALGLAVAAFGCQDRNAANRTNTGDMTGTATSAQNEEREQMQDAREQMQEAERDAAEKRADIQQDLQEEKADARQEMRDAQAGLGNPVTVTGTVSDVADDSFTLKTQDGQDLDIQVTDGSGRMSPPAQFRELKEGDQVRASYTEKDGNNVVQDLTVLQPAQDNQQK